MSDRNSGKWLPFNLDGTLHNCRGQTQTGTKNVETEIKPEAKAWVKEIMEGPKMKEFEERLKKVEALLFQGQNKK